MKIFLITTAMLVGIAGATYGFVAWFMPLTYSEALNRTLERSAKQLAESLSGYELQKAYELLNDFSQAYKSSLILIDSRGEVVYEEMSAFQQDVYTFSTVEDSDVSMAGEMNDMDNSPEDNDKILSDSRDEAEAVSGTEQFDLNIVDDMLPVGAQINSVEVTAAESPGAVEERNETSVENLEQRAMGRYPVSFKGSDQEYTLFVLGSTEQVNQAMGALKKILPWLVLTVLVISVLISVFYSRYLTRPVIRLSRVSRRMAELDFNVRSEEMREDEIGVLSESLDTMSESLDHALTELRDANAKLKDDMEREREQERRRVEFFSAASHELKTPVTILKGQIEGMIQGVGAYKDRDRYLLRAQEVTGTLETMVQEILTISRMESKGAPIQPKDTDLAELVRIELADLNELFEKKQMNMEINVPPKLIWETDASMMDIVIRNLLVNAVRYSPEKARISVGLSKEGNHAVVRVENSGVQIPQEDLEKIFQAFYRVDSSRNRRSGGSGLGLYIVREILEQHGAAYKIENTASGVQFTFRLPREIPTGGSPEDKENNSTQNT
ncbi:MAG: HAMP domain-containing sensor histidine kinase [Eubacteriales bacterium]|nr:HAMP domain-containing sensor histidine kinase [Eubacteriales bacterium]